MKKILKSMFSKKKTSVPLGLVNDETPFAISEAFRTLYTNVLYLNIEDKCKKIAVTSAISGEGKSTISINLALTIAQNAENKRVLIIDTDMRRPRVAELMSMENGHGLSEYLAGIDEEPNIIEVPERKISVLTSGGTNVNPTKLISSSRLNKLIEYCNERYDYVIVDTPPVDVVSDAMLLHDKVNGYILAVRADHSNITALDECIQKLNSVDSEIYGIALTSVPMKSGRNRAYRHYYYQYY